MTRLNLAKRRYNETLKFLLEETDINVNDIFDWAEYTVIHSNSSLLEFNIAIKGLDYFIKKWMQK